MPQKLHRVATFAAVTLAVHSMQLMRWRAKLPGCFLRSTPSLGPGVAAPGARLRPGRCGQRALSSDAGESEVSTWTVRKLRSFLGDRHLKHDDCFEKQELVERVRVAMQQEGNDRFSPAERDPSTFKDFGELFVQRAEHSGRTSDVVLLFLHGLGDTGQGWFSRLPSILGFPKATYLCPTAPKLAIPGMSDSGVVTSWFDETVIQSLMFSSSATDIMSTARPRTMQKSIDYCHYLIRNEIERGIPAKQVFLGGFSQGGCVATRAALAFPDAKLGGCIAASTFLGDATQLAISDVNKKLPVLCCHGDADQVVPSGQGRRLHSTLQERGVPAEWRAYNGLGHSSCSQEDADMRSFVRRQLLVAGGKESLERLPARELKRALQDVGIDIAGCYEKSDLLERADLHIFAS